MNIAVIGTGYVGLVTGTCFAEMGNQVVCVDIDIKKVEAMKAGKVPIYEPHLDLLFERNTAQGRLHFTTLLQEAVEKAHVIFLALPTPPDEDGSADLSAVLKVASQLGSLIRQYTVIVNKSTVPVGTADLVKNEILKSVKDKELFDVISNPEFLREGFAVDDFMKPDRVVVGTQSERAKKLMSELYAPFLRQGNPIYFMDARSAEMTKYAANAFLATKITFMNEIANLCEKTGANVDQVRIGIGADERIGRRFLFAGIGFGGSCFPKDVKALTQIAARHDYDFKILRSVIAVNEKQKRILVEKVKTYFNNHLNGKHIAVWGLSFKPDTDDIREAPSLYMIDELLAAGASVTAFDPEAMPNMRSRLGNKIKYAENPFQALEHADALIIATEWSVFRTPEFDKMKATMKSPVIFDGRNLYDPQRMKEFGFTYFSIGRP
ncbi:MAG: UDP-glucose/GDP-mannose dehydrogenase family protein [Bacteroidia bacterium]|nr:UDP-glucose/GDP-mannose dehydrogenase family protein [Bacteroidia bacterium]MCZ2277506.1 UDP-glucose/GDP-mannose dehydrogenase family protein [Bacteroidia bacterium]